MQFVPPCPAARERLAPSPDAKPPPSLRAGRRCAHQQAVLRRQPALVQRLDSPRMRGWATDVDSEPVHVVAIPIEPECIGP